MRPLDNKKHPPLSQLPREGQWSILQGEHDGNPIIVRLNTSLAAFRGHPKLGHQIGIAVPFKEPNADGLLSQDEYPALNAIEDLVLELFETPNKSVLAAVITTGGMREFVVYTSLPESTASLHEAIQARVDTGHEVQVIMQPDPDWNVYSSFLPPSN